MASNDPNVPGPSGYVSEIKAKRRGRRKGIPQKLSYYAEMFAESSDEDSVQPGTNRYMVQGAGKSLLAHSSKSPTKRKRDGNYASTRVAVESDILMGREDEKGSIMWAPKDSHNMVVGHNDYQVINRISRTVHLNEYFEIRSHGEFLPKQLEEECETGICEDLRGVWLRTGRTSGHNKRGNVKFTIQLNTFLQYLNEKAIFKFYLYEIYQSPSYSASRFIIAEDRDHQIPGDLVPYNFTIAGGPWYAEKNNKEILVHKFAKVVRGYKSSDRYTVKHEVEFFLKTREDIYSELFLYVHPFPENHSEANNGEGMCQKFQSAICSSRCPYALPKDLTTSEIEEDWTLETFAMYVSWLIQKQMDEKLLCLGCDEEVVHTFGDDMIPLLLKVVMQKSRQMFPFFVSGDRDEKPSLDWDKRETVMEEHKDMLEVVNKYVDKNIDELKNFILSEQTYAQMAASGKLEVHLGQMVESMAGELYGIVNDCFESLVVEMKIVLQKETEED
ncbi:uncharacterized protein [Palaemon carinicauda]